MDIEEIKNKVVNACKRVSDTEPGVWRTSEWNICSHLQSVLNEVFSDYNVDVELIKHDGRRPDIVIHKRGNNDDNLVIFQVKKDPNLRDIQSDLDKILGTFFAEPYNYTFGVLISIGKVPESLPEFDLDRIGIVEVDGWVLDQGNQEDDSWL